VTEGKKEAKAQGKKKPAEKKKAVKKVVVPVKSGRDQSWRPIMFSRTTAMVTIPTEIRDKANLIDVHNRGDGARITYDEQTGDIIIHPGVPKPEAAPVERKAKAEEDEGGEEAPEEGEEESEEES